MQWAVLFCPLVCIAKKNATRWRSRQHKGGERTKNYASFGGRWQANNGLDLNRSAKHGPMNGYTKCSHLFWDGGSSRLGLNMVTNIASTEMKRLFRWVIVQFWRYLAKAKREAHLWMLAYDHCCRLSRIVLFSRENYDTFEIEITRWYTGWKHN